MKKALKITGLLALMVTMVLAMSSFAVVTNTTSEKSCKVTIKYSNGDPADYVTVTASYGGVGGQHDWEYNEIKHLYIKGDKYPVDYSDGKSYTLTLKKKNKYD